MFELWNWITRNAPAISAIAAVCTVFGVWLAYSQLNMSQKIAQLQFEDSMVKEYRNLVHRLPTKALLGQELSDWEFQKAFDEFFHYIDLSNEQVFLRQQGKVGQKVWINWSEGIKNNLSLPAFRKAWRKIEKESNSFQELRRLEKADFKDDPKKWTPNVSLAVDSKILSLCFMLAALNRCGKSRIAETDSKTARCC